MPRKVIIYGDAEKLLDTVMDYIDAYPDVLASALFYDKDSLLHRNELLKQQISAGVHIDWDNLDDALSVQKDCNGFD